MSDLGGQSISLVTKKKWYPSFQIGKTKDLLFPEKKLYGGKFVDSVPPALQFSAPNSHP